MMVPQEVSMIVSSDPEAGAINRSEDGSRFEVQLQDGLKIPKEAVDVTVSVEESTVWWVIPNIITDVNDKMYITGPSSGGGLVETDQETMGYPSPGGVMSVSFSATEFGLFIPILLLSIADGFEVGDFVLIVDDDNGGALNGTSYEITSVATGPTSETYTILGGPVGLPSSNDIRFARLRGGVSVITNFVLTIPQGLYDLSGLNSAIIRELENEGAQTSPEPIISLAPDEATQKVLVKYAYEDTSIDFKTNDDTFRVILGFDDEIYGPFSPAPFTLIAPNTAFFNQVNYFLVHGDVSNKGIRFNNTYNQTLAQVLINVAPGSQIVSTPFNPPKVPIPELVGTLRTNLRFWLTDDRNRAVNTNGEYWSSRIVIRYLIPFILDEGSGKGGIYSNTFT